MKKYIEINTENIIKLHESGKTMREIGKFIGCSFTKIQKEINSYEFNKKISDRYKEIENKKIIAVCKKTKKEFIDYKNTSGAITAHLFDTYENFSVETNYKRKAFEYKNIKFWYDEYFNFIYKDIIEEELKKCGYCDWNTNDIDNKSGAYQNHLLKNHSLTVGEHIKKYPDDILYFKNYKRELKDNEKITCKICNKSMKVLTNTHMNKHGLTVFEYKNKFNIDIIYAETQIDGFRERYEESLKNNSFRKTSKAEQEISDFLTLLNIKHILNDREVLSGMEIDIFIPDYNIGIEYNGLYYHTDKFGKKDRMYHYNKTKICREKGIKLISIFEDEWISSKELILSKIRYFLKLSKNKIYGRNTIIKEINSYDKNIFLNKYHIQGEDKSIIKLGAFYNNELVAVMTFDNNRQFSKEKNHNIMDYELKRFATTTEYNVIGIGSKLFKYFLKNYESNKIISFLDNRWAINDINIYDILGFKLIKKLKPDYSYFNPKVSRNKRLHKFAYGKKRLKTLFPEIYSDNKTEWEIMQEAGYDRIWDCGKLKYVYDCTPI